MLGEIYIERAREGKGRTFSANLLAYVTADSLWSGGTTDVNAIRPVWMTFACSPGEARAFMANLQAGKKAIIGDQKNWSRKKAPCIELLRSADYVYQQQRFAEGTVVTVYLQSLFVLDPGMVDPQAGIRFVILPPMAGDEVEECLEDKPSEADLRTIDRLAPIFASFVDRRSRAPLIPDPMFYRLLLLRCLENNLASFSRGDRYYRQRWGRFLNFEEHETSTVKLSQGLAMLASHESFEKLLAEVVVEFYDSAQKLQGAA